MLVLAVVPGTARAHADVNPGWQATDDGDAVSTDIVSDPVVDGLADLGLTASKCVAHTNVPKHATIIYSDAAGQPTYAWHHDIVYSYDCKTVTRITHSSYPEIFQPEYTFAGYVVNSVTPAGQRTATATAQGRFGICESIVGETCALERDPSIVWHVDAGGKAYAKTTP
jgi:hypothetical protein